MAYIVTRQQDNFTPPPKGNAREAALIRLMAFKWRKSGARAQGFSFEEFLRMEK
jgi:hypothetical protein